MARRAEVSHETAVQTLLRAVDPDAFEQIQRDHVDKDLELVISGQGAVKVEMCRH